MAEYIERMSAIETACKGCNKEFSNEHCEPSECYIQQGLFNIPASDVVQVVRCKDCKHRDTVICPMSATYEDYPWKDTRDDDFCSYGERKDNG